MENFNFNEDEDELVALFECLNSQPDTKENRTTTNPPTNKKHPSSNQKNQPTTLKRKISTLITEAENHTPLPTTQRQYNPSFWNPPAEKRQQINQPIRQ